MPRIDDTMRALGARGRKALVAYLCMGDPTLAESVDLAVACAEAGADILELGTPFSDPTADGPVIAKASERALANGGGLTCSLDAARAIRARTDVPLLLFGYYNPLFVRGEARAVGDARDAGVDGLLVVDLPVDESASLRALCKASGLSLSPLLAPTSVASRVELTRRSLAECEPGFVYYVSVAGVTGAAGAPLDEAGNRVRSLKRDLGAAVVIGFGIDSPDKAKVAAQQADGIVVGSALVRLVPDGAAISELIRRIRRAID